MESGTPEHLAAVSKALAPLQRAQDLHDRVGTKGLINKLRKVLATAAKEQAGTPPAA